MPKLRILLVDDHPVVLEGLRTLLNGQLDMRIVGEAHDGIEAVNLARQHAPDVVVMDVAMPRLGGAKATRELKAVCPTARVLALSVHEQPGYLRLLFDAGASGYVVKLAAPAELVQAIRTVAAGGTYLDPRLGARMVGGISGRVPCTPETATTLSERETEVLRLVALGYSAKEIAASLGISVKTVDTYRSRAMEKLDLQARTDLVRYALQVGWLDNP